MQKEIKQIVEERGIRYLYHFTELSNVPSIVELGLLPKSFLKKLERHGILFNQSDENRYDQRDDTISCSIMWPNYRMFYKLRKKTNAPAYVLIRLDAAILWKLPCLFFPENAANAKYIKEPDEKFEGYDAFIRLFSENINDCVRLASKTYKFWPTHPEAEIMVKQNIPREYIISIICENTMDYNKVCQMCGTDCKISIIDNSKQLYSLFGVRSDYGNCMQKTCKS